MKKYIISLLFLLLSSPVAHARSDGGAIAAGALGGLAVGTMLGSASASQSRRAYRVEDRAVRAQERAEQEALRAQARAEQEALRAQEKVEQIRVEQGQQRIAQLERELERRSIEQKISQSRTKSGNDTQNTMQIILLGLIGILTLAVIGLAIIVFRRP